jgi:hypothetical protein
MIAKILVLGQLPKVKAVFLFPFKYTNCIEKRTCLLLAARGRVAEKMTHP